MATSSRKRTFVAAAIGLGLAAIVAFAGPSVTNGGNGPPGWVCVDPNTDQWQFSFHVDTDTMDVKDVHVLLPHKLGPTPQAPFHNGCAQSETDKWTSNHKSGSSATGGRVNFYVRDTNDNMDGCGMDFGFTVFNAGKAAWGIPTIVFTSDGNDNPNTGTIASVPIPTIVKVTTPGGGTILETRGIQVCAAITPSDTVIAWGAATPVGIVSTEPGRNYQLFIMSSETGCPNPWEDPDGFMMFASNNPVTWASFNNIAGTLDPEGAASFTVNVPAEEENHGRTFYVVAQSGYAEDPDEDFEDTRIYTWPPVSYMVD
jgi:hypothetical protein